MKKLVRPVLLALLAGVTGAFAQTYDWTNATGGDWTNTANWNPATVPSGLGTVARFGVAGTYTVKLQGNVGISTLRDNTTSLDMTLDLNGYLFDGLETGSNLGFYLGANGSPTHNVIITSSVPGGEFRMNRARTGASATAYTALTFTGTNLYVNFDVNQDSIFNYWGSGRLTVSDGARMDSAGMLLFGLGDKTTYNPSGTFLITDPGTVVNANRAASAALIGKHGSGATLMIVSNGASFNAPSGSLTVGAGADTVATASTNAYGKAVVTGTNSFLYAQSLVAGSYAGNGVLTQSGYAGTAGGFIVVENGGRAQVGSLALSYGAGTGIWTNTSAYGELVIRGAGSLFTNAGAGVIGRAAQGALYVLNGGQYRAASSANLILGQANAVATYTNSSAYGLLVISNTGSYVASRALFVGGDTSADNVYGHGDVIVTDNGHLKTVDATAGITLRPRSSLTVSDALVESATLVLQTNTTLRIELGARDHANAYVQLTGNLNLAANVTLDLGILDDFSAMYGDSIWLITAGGYAGTAGAFANYTDGDQIHIGDYDFEYQQWNDASPRIVLSVIPEPATFGLIGAGLGIAALLRRRHRRG